jgi:ribosomal protein S18 acetylase RimI-like enzyme
VVTGLHNPVWSALTGRQAGLGLVRDSAARFDPEVSPFAAFADGAGPEQWDDLAVLLGPSGTAALVGPGGGSDGLAAPDGWIRHGGIPGIQMVFEPPVPFDTRLLDGSLPLPLGPDDVPDMLALVDRSRPGPFLARTVEFGGYLGIRREGRLVAMAGERLQPAGHVEISAVTTDPDYRRQGLAQLLVRAVAASILERGDVPILHVAEDNTGALTLYRAMGFEVTRTMAFELVQAPPGVTPGYVSPAER